jgi:hypothetical protein
MHRRHGSIVSICSWYLHLYVRMPIVLTDRRDQWRRTDAAVFLLQSQKTPLTRACSDDDTLV